MSRNDNTITFNTTYYSVFKSIRNILEELHILLAQDQQHRTVFTDIPRIGFKNGKSFKNHPVRSVLHNINVAGNSKTKYRYRPNDYKSTHRKFTNKKEVLKDALKQKNVHEHFCSNDHNGIQDLVITLIRQGDDEKFLRQRELFWAHKVLPRLLNQREVNAAY